MAAEEQLDENENEFKNRINPPGVYQAHRDSEGLLKETVVWVNFFQSFRFWTMKTRAKN